MLYEMHISRVLDVCLELHEMCISCMLGNSCPAVWKLAFCLGEVTFGWGVSSLVAVRNIMFIVKRV